MQHHKITFVAYTSTVYPERSCFTQSLGCLTRPQAELDALRSSAEQASSAGSEQAAEWRGRAEAAEREVAAVRDRARALMEEKDSEIAALRVRGFLRSLKCREYEQDRHNVRCLRRADPAGTFSGAKFSLPH